MFSEPAPFLSGGLSSEISYGCASSASSTAVVDVRRCKHAPSDSSAARRVVVHSPASLDIGSKPSKLPHDPPRHLQSISKL